MPERTSANDRMPVTSWPRSSILPEEGLSAPVMSAKSVVLPAPLGPMKPEICPSATLKLTSFKAATPPKYFVSRFTSRMFNVSPEDSPQQSHQAIGLQQDYQYQQRAIKQQMDLRKIRYQLLLDDAKDDPAEHRPPDGSDTADHRHEQDVYA